MAEKFCLTSEKINSAIMLLRLRSKHMSARDAFYGAVKTALQNDGWVITHDPLSLEFGLGSLYIDLGAERVIAA